MSYDYGKRLLIFLNLVFLMYTVNVTFSLLALY